MNPKEEFLAQFNCEAPEHLPEYLKTRLQFVSCLSQKKTRSIYLVKDTEKNEKAILKTANANSPDNVKREFEILSKLKHGGIPEALYYTTDSVGDEYLLRSYAEGETLAFLLQRDGVFETLQILKIMEKLCEILAYLHGQSPPIVYRDITPQNIILTPNGKVSIIDFGISREETKDKNFDTTYVGSTAFAAPEQFGFTKTDNRTDVFSLGRLMIYMSTGGVEQSTYETEVKSKELVKLIKKCTMLSPEKRYDSVEKLSKDIAKILYPPTKNELALFGSAAVAVIAVGLGTWFFTHTPTKEIPVSNPISASGAEFKEEVKVPVLIEATKSGVPFTDCAVSVDNHHWFVPNKDGQAEVLVYAFDDYKARVVSENRTAFAKAEITRDGGPYRFALEMDNAPLAPEYIPIKIPFGESHTVPLAITKADEVIVSGQPEGISVEKQGDAFVLAVKDTVEAAGYYTLFLESSSEFGVAESVVSLHLESPQEVTVIKNKTELLKMRENLSGNYELAADIDLSGIDWLPVGTEASPFLGTFDGKHHTISNLSVSVIFSNESPTGGGDSGMFGVVKNGMVRDVILLNANVKTLHTVLGGTGMVVGNLVHGVVENCAVLGGKIDADIGIESAAGGIVGMNRGIISGCFNSSEVLIRTGNTSKDRVETYAGGISGMSGGYITDCGNTGAVTGISQAGGITAYSDQAIVTRCYNAGKVKAPAYLGVYEVGGIAQIEGRGKRISYSCFEKGTAPVGATVFNRGTLLGIIPIAKEDFKNLNGLNDIFHADMDLRFSSLDSYYPIPKGVLNEKLEQPHVVQNGDQVSFGETGSDCSYFFTVDGSDPKQTGGTKWTGEEILLKQNQELKVFAAKSGFEDSEAVSFKWQ